MKRFSLAKKTFSSKKYYSMLLGGTLTSIVVTILLMSDFMIAGVCVGNDAVTSINLVIPIYTLSVFFGEIFSLGVPLLFSKEMGRFDKDKANKIYAVANLTTIIVGIISFVLLSLFGDDYIAFYNPGTEVFNYSIEYLNWMRFVALILPFTNLLAGMVYADGDEKLGAVSNIIFAFMNIILSYILGRRFGVSGIGLASFIAYILLILMCLFHFLKKSNSLKLGFTFSFTELKEIVRFSFVDSSIFFSLAIFSFVINKYFELSFGVTALSLVVIINLIKEIDFIFDGIGNAMTPLISIYYGEESYKGIEEVFKLARQSSIVESLFITTLLWVFAPNIVYLLGINTEPYLSLSIYALRVMSLSYVFTSFIYLITTYYLLINEISFGIIISFMRDLIAILFLSILFGNIFGIKGVFWGVALSPIVVYSINALIIIRRRGIKNYPLMLDKMTNNRSLFYEFMLSPQNIMDIQAKMIEGLKKESCSDIAIARASLIFEEIYMLVYNKNKGKTVYAECSISILDDKIKMILKDDGELFDITDSDINVDSLSSYVVSSMLSNINRKQYLMTLSYNRNVFEIKRA